MGRLDSMVSINLNLKKNYRIPITDQEDSERGYHWCHLGRILQFFIYMFLHLIILVGLEMFEDLM